MHEHGALWITGTDISMHMMRHLMNKVAPCVFTICWTAKSTPKRCDYVWFLQGHILYAPERIHRYCTHLRLRKYRSRYSSISRAIAISQPMTLVINLYLYEKTDAFHINHLGGAREDGFDVQTRWKASNCFQDPNLFGLPVRTNFTKHGHNATAYGPQNTEPTVRHYTISESETKMFWVFRRIENGGQKVEMMKWHLKQ